MFTKPVHWKTVFGHLKYAQKIKVTKNFCKRGSLSHCQQPSTIILSINYLICITMDWFLCQHKKKKSGIMCVNIPQGEDPHVTGATVVPALTVLTLFISIYNQKMFGKHLQLGLN